MATVGFKGLKVVAEIFSARGATVFDRGLLKLYSTSAANRT